MTDCFKSRVPCNPDDVDSCADCLGEIKFICGPGNHCVLSENQVNPFLETPVIENDGSTLIRCKYPDFLTQVSQQETCRDMVGCYPTGRLLLNGKEFYDYGKIKSWKNFTCECGVRGFSRNSLMGPPECVATTIGDTDHDFKGCVGFPYLNGGCICPKGYVSSKDEKGLVDAGYRSTVAYRATQLKPTCLMKPCLFDPFTGKRHDSDVLAWSGKSCLCDPLHSIIGIRIEEAGGGNAVDSSEINACLDISDASEKVKETYIFSEYYLPPKGAPQHAFKTWSYNPSMFPLFHPVQNKDTYVTTQHMRFPDKEYPLDLEDKSVSVPHKKRRIELDKPDSLFVKLSDKYQIVSNSPYRVGDVVRNPESLPPKGKIHPLLISDTDSVTIYEQIYLPSDSDLIFMPRLKPEKEDK